MAKIKHTKNELKTQRDALRRFERYLPTLQLKKQQLQVEMRQLEVHLREKEADEKRKRTELSAWVSLFSEEIDFKRYLKLSSIKQSVGNVAGVSIPVLESVVFRRNPVNLFDTPPWIDRGLSMLESLIRLRVERRVMEEQRDLLEEELRITTQRVNLFEKVKIPESREHIRVIRIFLGDQQTAEVARAKIAKAKNVRKERGE